MFINDCMFFLLFLNIDLSLLITYNLKTTNTNDSVNLLLNIHLSIELCYHNLSKYMGDCSYYIEHLISNLSYKCPSSIYDDKSIIFEVDKENYFVEECFIAQISRREISFILKNYNHVKLLQIQKWSSNLEHELNLFIGHIKVFNILIFFFFFYIMN